MRKIVRAAIMVAVLIFACFWQGDAGSARTLQILGNYIVYVGTYTGPKSQGIYAFKFVASTRMITPLGLAAATVNPSFLVVHPNHRFLYAVNEISNYGGQKSGSVSAFSIDPKKGKLTLLNVVASGDPGPCHITVDRTGRYVLLANYDVGSVAVFPISADGRLGKATAFIPHTGHSIDPKRQQGPHAHCVTLSPDNHFVFVADLGTDQVYVYRFDATKGTLTPNDPPSVAVPPGSGPRHFALHRNGKFAYVIGELGSNLTAFSYDGTRGSLHPLETISTLPSGYKGENRSSELEFHPSGKYLYGSNRGYDSITVFSVDAVKGTPTPIQYIPSGGKTPRGFGVDPVGADLFAANLDSNTVVLFRIDPLTGRLRATGQKLDVPSPTCIVFEPTQ